MQAQEEARIFEEIGRSIEEAGRSLVQAIDYYSQALRFEPYNAAFYNNRAAAYFSQGEFRKASFDYARALQYYPADRSDRRARASFKLGLCHYMLQEYDAAGTAFTRAISYRADISDSYYFRGKVRHLTGQNLDGARADFEEVVRLSTAPSVQAAFSRYFLNDLSAAAAEMLGLLESTADQPLHYAHVCYAMAGLQGIIGNDLECAKYLRLAMQHGYADRAWLERDPNFQAVAGQPYFAAFLDDYRLVYRLAPAPAQQPLPATGRPGITLEETVVPLRSQPQTMPDNDRPLAPASLRIGDIVFHDPGQNNRIDAEESCYLTLRVVNEGPGYARGLRLLVHETEGVDGLRFDSEQTLGDLAAGLGKDIRIPLEALAGLSGEQAVFVLQVQEQNGFDALPVEVSVPVLPYQPPRLAVYDHHFASERGGRMELGVPILLKLAVQNEGLGVAEDVQLRFALPDNVFPAGDETFVLGTLQRGESRVIDFEFFTNRRYTGEAIPIRVVAQERRGAYGLDQTFVVRLDQQLEVAGRVVVTAREAAPVDISQLPLLSDVDRNLPQTRSANPDAVAVVIGNRDYRSSDVPSVDFALHDAASMRKYLIEAMGFREENILFLPNATQADFYGVFGSPQDYKARLFNLVDSGQTDIFIYYSGHGAPDLESSEAYFVPVDCDPTLVRFNGYALSTFYDNLARLPYRSLTIIIDACFSGASDRGTLIPQASLVRIKSNNNVMKDPRAAVFLATGGAQIASWYSAQSHALFTYYFLKGLQGAANTDRDRVLTVGELRAYLSEQVPLMARRLSNRTQEPEVYGKDSGVILTY
ncbi:MAG: hypothetical protein OHK0039_42830 [Bacteroidia bacterium]